MRYLHLLILTTFLLTSCVSEESPLETFSRDYAVVNGGDLVVTNYSGDSAVLLDSDGNFKRLLYNVENNAEQVVGVNWNDSTNEIILSINGTPDRVVSISPLDGAATDTIISNQYNGNPFGLMVDSSGDFLLIESHQVEKFTSNGVRINDGTFPTGTLFNNLAQINPLAAGGFLVCGSGGDQVATYDESAVQIDNKVSGIGGTTNGYGCDETASGDIVAAWEGSTDTIALYNSDFSTTIATYNDSAYMSSPRGVEVKSNGNILVADAGYHYLIELDSELQFVRVLGGGLLNYPWQVIEIPEY